MVANVLGILLILVAFAVALAPLLSFIAAVVVKVLFFVLLALGTLAVFWFCLPNQEAGSTPPPAPPIYQPLPPNMPSIKESIRLSISPLCQLDTAIYETPELRHRKGEIACLATTYLMVLRLSDPQRKLQVTDWSGDMVERLVEQTQGGRVVDEKARIKAELNRGYPVIVGANSPASINHWVLITGYDGDRFLIHDPWTGEAHKALEQAVRYSPSWTTRFLKNIPTAKNDR